MDWIKGKFLVTKEGNKYLAVLHNRNKMVNAFASTEWVAGSEGAVLSRSVTSCAGMTAYLVFAGTNQSGIPQWGTWEEFPSAHPTGAGCPERRGLCKSNGGPY